jgi:hypothetical protein
MKRVLQIVFLIIPTLCLNAQDSSNNRSLTFSAYAEVYYQYDLNKPADGNRPGFFYSHNRHNEFNLNLGFVKIVYSAERARANLAFAAGTYVNANYTAEPGVLKNIFEANAGIKLSKKNNLWLDAGIFPSHIGFESAASKDCWTLSRSILADNSPYFEAGAKITYITGDGKWMLSGMALNGWQRITRLAGNSLMSWGTQMQYKPSSKLLLNYGTFLGTDKPDSARQIRLFHNLYGIIALSDKLGLTLGFDLGTEERLTGETNTWYAPAGILKYTINDKWAIAGRAEYYNDKNGVMISTGTTHGFQTAGFSLNIDLSPVNNLLLRLEGKRICSKDAVFSKGSTMTKTNSAVMASLSVAF